MGAIASQIASLTILYSIVYSDADQRKHQSSVSLASVRGIHRGPVDSPHKWPVTRKMFPFDDVIMRHIGVILLWRTDKRLSVHSMYNDLAFSLSYSIQYLLYSPMMYREFIVNCRPLTWNIHQSLRVHWFHLRWQWQEFFVLCKIHLSI